MNDVCNPGPPDKAATKGHLEMTIRIDPHAHPLLHAYLSERDQGRPRAAALKRIAENALLLASAPSFSATNVTMPSVSALDHVHMTRPETHDARDSPALTSSAILASLEQFE